MSVIGVVMRGLIASAVWRQVIGTRGTIAPRSFPPKSQLMLRVVTLVLSIPLFAAAQSARFDRTTDTIRLPCCTTLVSAATYEAILLPFESSQNDGSTIWNEFRSGLGDKHLSVGPNRIYGYSYPINLGDVLTANVPLAPCQWHHVAYCYDGNQERLYLDGQLVRFRPGSGMITTTASAPRSALSPGVAGSSRAFAGSSTRCESQTARDTLMPRSFLPRAI